MGIHVIEYAVTGEINECVDEQEARDTLERQYPGCVFAEQWDADGVNDDGQPMERLLVWADEESAENDCGVDSIAQITRIREDE